MGTILNIHANIDNNTDNFWFHSNQMNEGKISTIKNPTGNSINKLLSAIPSPLARLHLFETAFKFVDNHTAHDGTSVFHQLVSDCLDVYELVFNMNKHKAAGAAIDVRIWSFQDEINSLVSSPNKGNKILGESLKIFLNTPPYNTISNFSLFLYQNSVFAGSSPLTGFYTSPDVRNITIINPNNNKPYFSEIIPLHARDLLFQQMMTILFKKNNAFANQLQNVRNYVFNNVKYISDSGSKQLIQGLLNKTSPDYNFAITNLQSSHGNIIEMFGATIPIADGSQSIQSPLLMAYDYLPEYCNGWEPIVFKDNHDLQNNSNQNFRAPTNLSPLCQITHRNLPYNNTNYPFVYADDFLEDKLIQVDYRLNSSFYGPELQNFKHTDDIGFVLPLKKEFFEFFDRKRVTEMLTIQPTSYGGYEVTLSVPTKSAGKVKYSKVYIQNPQSPNAGELINYQFNLGIFPFYRVVNKPEYNDFYKIMLVDGELTQNFNMNLAFYQLNQAESISIHPVNSTCVNRTQKSVRSGDNASFYYEIQQTNFDLIEVGVKDSGGNMKAKGVIVPIWREVPLGVRKYKASVDFGTTNTYVALVEPGTTKPHSTLTIGEDDLQVVMYNAPAFKANVQNKLDLYENIEGKLVFLKENQYYEFIPSLIGKQLTDSKYSIPTRTVMSYAKGKVFNQANPAIVLGDANISFVYNKEPKYAHEDLNTDLKWGVHHSGNKSILIETFIKQILYMLRTKIILNGGDPAETEILWFKPLSMIAFSQALLERTWNQEFSRIFHTNRTTYSITESEAPFHYLLAKNQTIHGNFPCVNIDIGGGSTDIVLFKDKEAKFGTSFNFAGDALWGPDPFVAGTIPGSVNSIADHYYDIIKNQLQNSSFKAYTEIINDVRKNNPGDLINLFFTLDINSRIGFMNSLMTDMNIRTLILIHFSAIMYHTLQIVKNLKWDAPRFISFSGQGSRYLDLLCPSNKNIMHDYVNEFIKDIFGTVNPQLSIITSSQEPKELTCYGGLYYDMRKYNVQRMEKITSLGDGTGDDLHTEEFNRTYSNLDDNFGKNVRNNIRNFLDLVIKVAGKQKYQQSFFIVNNIREVLNQYNNNKLDDFYGLGLQFAQNRAGDDGLINETLFFYPITKILFDLSTNLYNKNANTNK